jgi:hypothetical protein
MLFVFVSHARTAVLPGIKLLSKTARIYRLDAENLWN